MPIPAALLYGAGTALAPSIIDLFTGASKKRREAYDAEQNQIQQMLDSITSEAGKSASDSLYFKTAQNKLGEGYKRQSQTNMQNAAAQGLSNEGQLGQLQGANEAYGGATVQALLQADQERKRLLQQHRLLTLQKLGLARQEAEGGSAAQSGLFNSAASLIPHLIGEDPQLTTEYDPLTGLMRTH